ncbi:DNA-binding protein [Mesotoga sp. Brook.08.YT.4.2.5.1]|uniref:YceD family protein n=1 Tax=unclassified Mesotoga TaxID=1184398 RepID=UPI000C9AEEC0|nr:MULTISPECIES: DUF177 domain-containing protein [unclassified Mesotoga]PNE22557.1 DNA-binding protein [Mesotoga sp. Brook.08.YT.4.2.5.1]RAM59090.1 hypothetical protein DS65_02115 [Mesotoga sp. SC_4PWL113PWK15]RAO95695.1 DNA-binding protein [Mesotoga sp. Brook.08.YT.4.2.5.4.]RDI94061.1 hypothetical protein Q502_00845 [Mesotoga sp. Brook.08.YT.4.2.5.2.]
MAKIHELIVDLNSFEFKKTIDVVLDPDFTEEIKLTSAAETHIELYKDKDSIIVTGSVKTILEENCARCLKEVSIPIEGTIEATYVLQDSVVFAEDGTSADLDNVLRLEGDLLDLSERVIEAIIVEVPQKVLCKRDCAGLCPYCGANLNDEQNHSCQKREEIQDEWHKAISDLREKLKS